MALIRKVRIWAALTALLLANAAQAQITSDQQNAIRSSCRSDFMSKCQGVTPGGKDALVCLQQNVASLSASCKTAVSATIPAPTPAPVAAKPAEPAPAPVPPAAAAPTAASPASAQPAVVSAPTPPSAKPQQAQKPVAPAKQPAPAPKQATAAPAAAPQPAAATPAAVAPLPTEQQMKAIGFTCRREFADNCRGVQPGSAEAVECLQRNATKLTPDCMTSLAALDDAMPPAAGPMRPTETRTPNAPVVMTAVVGRACMRDLLLHCRDAKIGEGQKIACLMERGPALAPVCQAALKITEPVR